MSSLSSGKLGGFGTVAGLREVPMTAAPRIASASAIARPLPREATGDDRKLVSQADIGAEMPQRIVSRIDLRMTAAIVRFCFAREGSQQGWRCDSARSKCERGAE